MQIAEVIRDPNEETLGIVMKLVKAARKAGLDAGDRRYIRRRLFNPRNINIFLKDGVEEVGYLMVVPHNSAYRELKKDDPLMTRDSARYYINLVIVLPEHRRVNGFLKLLQKMFEETEERFGISKFSLHCRIKNNLSKVVQKVFEDTITCVRHIEHWRYAGTGEGEPYDYIEGNSPIK
jgi:hypothetical protein